MIAKTLCCSLMTLITAVPPPSNCICLLQRTEGGAHANKFSVEFTPNPMPQPGQAHGNAACDAPCDPQIGGHCNVNGTMAITNNSSWTVVVNWQGQIGGASIAPNTTGNFETGYETLPCGEQKDVNFDAGSDGVVAHSQWKCNSCAVPPDGS